MTPQERELLSNLFDRLRQCEGNPKEPEAAAFIADAVARQPGAPYFMAQLLLVQDQALSAAQTRIRALEQAGEATEKAAQPTAAPSFLPEMRQHQAEPPQGPWGAYRPSVLPAAGPARPQGPPYTAYPGPASPQPQPAGGSGVGSFLRGALQTATGVAGGALLFEGISSLFHHGGMPWGLGGSGFLPTGAGPTLVEDTVINEYDQPQQPFVPGTAPDLAGVEQGDIEQAGYAPDADPSGVEDSPADDGFVDDSDLSDPDDLDQA